MCRVVSLVIGLVPVLGSLGASADVVAVVAVENPVSSLTRNEIADIFLGKLTRFHDGRLVLPIDQVENSSERTDFYLKFTGRTPAQIKAFWSKVIFTGKGQPPPEVSSGIEVKQFIAKHPDAIGYIDAKLVDHRVKVVRTE